MKLSIGLTGTWLLSVTLAYGEGRSPHGPPKPLHAMWPMQLCLVDGSRIRVQPVDLDSTYLVVRTAWADRLAVPRSAIESLTVSGEYRLVGFDDFSQYRSIKRREREPPIVWSATRQRPVLALTQAGQCQSWSIPPMPAGQLTLHYFDPGPRSTSDFTLELRSDQSTLVMVRCRSLAGLTADDRRPQARQQRWPVPRTRSWQRLVVRWTPNRCEISVDDWMALVSEVPPPATASAVRAIHLRCAATGSPWLIDTLAWAEPMRPRTPPDIPISLRRLDAVETHDGWTDFGQLHAIDPHRGVTLTIRDQSRHIPWTAIASVRFRFRGAKYAPTQGEHCFVSLHSGEGQRDTFEAVIREQTPHRLTWHHALIGKATVPTSRIAAQRRLFVGQRWSLLDQPLHLGQGRQPTLLRPQADATHWKNRLGVPANGESVELLLTARQVRGVVRLSFNGTPFAELTSGDRAVVTYHHQRIPLPAVQRLRPEDEVRFDIHADDRLGASTHLEIYDLRVQTRQLLP